MNVKHHLRKLERNWRERVLILALAMMTCVVPIIGIACSPAKQPAATNTLVTTTTQPTFNTAGGGTPTARAVLVPSQTFTPSSSSEVTPTDIALAKTPTATFAPPATFTPLPSCGRSIVFETQDRRTHSLAIVDACSRETTILTDDTGDDEWPRWSPDGQHVAFLSDRTRRSKDYRDLWLMDVATGELSQLTSDAMIWPYGAAFVWSPDGNEIAYSSDIGNGFESKPWIVNLHDGRNRPLPGCLDGPFSWSPDGTRIALYACLELPDRPPEEYENDMWFPGNLVVVRPDGSLVAGRSDLDGYRLPNSDEWLWAPDGEHLAVAFGSSLRGDGGDLELVKVEKDELIPLARLRDILPSLEYRDVQSLAWSPSGQEIAFVVVTPPVRARPYWGQVYVADRGLADFRTVTPEGMYCDGVQWSPDGTQLAFACDAGEPYASIWIVNADGSDLHAITRPAKGTQSPQWRPLPVPQIAVPSPTAIPITWTLAPTETIPQNVIAFSSNRRAGGQDFDIWFIRSDGSGLALLPTGSCAPSDDSRSERQPVWSSDGRKLAFISASNISDHPPLLCVIDFELGTTVIVSDVWNISTFAWASDNQQIVGSKSAGGMWIFDLDPPHRSQLLYEAGGPGSWAPDGRKIGTGRGKWETFDFTGLEIVGLDGTLFEAQDEGIPLGSGAGIVQDVSWSPDGKYALVGYRASHWGGYLALFEVDAESRSFSFKASVSDFEQYPDGLDYCGSSWSPDGKRVVFVSGGPYWTGECAGHLYLADADLSNIAPLIEENGLFGSPAWSPDDRSILFVKAREVHEQGQPDPSPGSPESIWIVDSDGTHLRRLVGGDGYVYNRPMWQPAVEAP